jgi:hypothetical protein
MAVQGGEKTVKYLEENFVEVFVTKIKDKSKNDVDIEMTHIQSDGLMF